VGTWANTSKTVVLQLRSNGTVVVHDYSITDEVVELYWRTNRGLSGGGFYDRRNPEALQTNYTGNGTYTIDKDNINIKLSLQNQFGTAKNISLVTKFTLNNQKNFLRLSNGFARKFIYNKDTRDQIDTSEFVSSFYRE
jgi:hypothetical protein